MIVKNAMLVWKLFYMYNMGYQSQRAWWISLNIQTDSLESPLSWSLKIYN